MKKIIIWIARKWLPLAERVTLKGWEDVDRANLRVFLASATGRKLVAQLKAGEAELAVSMDMKEPSFFRGVMSGAKMMRGLLYAQAAMSEAEQEKMLVPDDKVIDAILSARAMGHAFHPEMGRS